MFSLWSQVISKKKSLWSQVNDKTKLRHHFFFFSGNESSSNLHWLDDSVPKPKTAKSKDKFQKENLLSFNRRYDMGFVNTVLTYIQNSFH